MKNSPKSVLAIVNLADFRFDTEILNIMKSDTIKSQPFQKKVALIGVKPIHQAAFNFGFAITFQKTVKVLSQLMKLRNGW